MVSYESVFKFHTFASEDDVTQFASSKYENYIIGTRVDSREFVYSDFVVAGLGWKVKNPLVNAQFALTVVRDPYDLPKCKGSIFHPRIYYLRLINEIRETRFKTLCRFALWLDCTQTTRW